MEKIVKDQKEYSKDNRMIEVYYKEDEYKRLYDTKEEVEEAREQGIQQGIQEGSNQTKTEIALNLLEKGISIDIISETTGLSIDEINALKEK